MNVRKFRKDNTRHLKMRPYSRRVELYRVIVKHSNGMLPQEHNTPVYVQDARGR